MQRNRLLFHFEAFQMRQSCMWVLHLQGPCLQLQLWDFVLEWAKETDFHPSLLRGETRVLPRAKFFSRTHLFFSMPSLYSFYPADQSGVIRDLFSESSAEHQGAKTNLHVLWAQGIVICSVMPILATHWNYLGNLQTTHVQIHIKNFFNWHWYFL